MSRITEQIKYLMPEWMLMGQLVLRRAHAWQQAGVIFVHVPKNGGTSINNAVYGRFMGHCRVRDIARIRPDLLRKLPSLALTRNPWARAYSAYNFARLGASMSDGAQIRQPYRYAISEFESFERFILEWLPERDIDCEDYVFRPQTHFLLDKEDTIGVTHVGKIEEKQSYLPFLEKTLSRRVEIGHLNQTTKPEGYRAAYTPEMRDIVSRCYADDIARFNYDF